MANWRDREERSGKESGSSDGKRGEKKRVEEGEREKKRQR